MCESSARWISLQRKDLIMTGLIAVPASAFIVSYFLLFPLATYIEGRFSYPHPTINKYLDKLHFGQLWVEFGYEIDYIEKGITTLVRYRTFTGMMGYVGN